MSLPKTPPPVTAAECSDEWVALRRAIIRRDGRALRAGGPAHTIELKSMAPVELLVGWAPLPSNEWFPITLPNGAATFTTAADRDHVLAKLLQ